MITTRDFRDLCVEEAGKHQDLPYVEPEMEEGLVHWATEDHESSYVSPAMNQCEMRTIAMRTLTPGDKLPLRARWLRDSYLIDIATEQPRGEDVYPFGSLRFRSVRSPVSYPHASVKFDLEQETVSDIYLSPFPISELYGLAEERGNISFARCNRNITQLSIPKPMPLQKGVETFFDDVFGVFRAMEVKDTRNEGYNFIPPGRTSADEVSEYTFSRTIKRIVVGNLENLFFGTLDLLTRNKKPWF